MAKSFDEAFAAANAELGGDAGADDAAILDNAAAPAADTPAADDAAAVVDPNAAAADALPELKPDENWSKEAKEAFAALYGDPERRKLAEAWHKEHQTFDTRYRERQSQYDRLAHEHQQARGFLEQFSQAISPFAGYYQREGLTPIQGLQRDASWGQYIRENPQQAFLQLAKQIGVDPAQLSAEQPWVDPQVTAVRQYVDSQLQPIAGFVQRAAQQQQWEDQQRQEQAFAGAMSEIEAFKAATDEQGQPKYPLFNDVVGEMQAVVDFANARKQPITTEQAYTAAVRLSDTAWAKHQEAEKRRSEDQARRAAAARLAEANKAKTANGARSPNGSGGSRSEGPPKDAADAVSRAMRELGA